MESMDTYPLRELRKRARLSLVKVSAAAGVAINTTMRYEVARHSVTESKREALDAVYNKLGAALGASQ